MKWLQCLITAACIFTFNAQADEYRGFIGGQQIHLSLDFNDRYGVYMYDAYNHPIVWTDSGEPQKDGTILLNENKQYAAKSSPIARITLQQNPRNEQEITGIWQKIQTDRQLPIQLTRYIESAGALQSAAFKNSYMRKICTEDENKTVRIYDKKTNHLQHTIQTSGQCHDDEADVNDYNFDGFEDFSVFENSFAGPNTTRAYYLYDPKSATFKYNDQLSDVSLNFDTKNKIVTSTNQCCAGSQILILRSKWQGQTLKPFDKTCLKYDHKRNELVKVGKNQCN